MNMKPTQKYLRLVAAIAETDPRTVARHLAGRPIRELSRERIERAVHSDAVRAALGA